MAEPTGLRIGMMLALTRAALEQAGIADAGREARLLVQAVAAVPTTMLVAAPEAMLTAAQAAAVEDALRRRCRHEPLSRIVGRRGFYGRDFLVTPATLDPRPETETVVETVLSIVRAEGGDLRPLRVLDIGTGTGAILLTLLAELPLATGLGTDISAEALTVAGQNAVTLGVAHRATLQQARTLDGVSGSFDVVVSNPPYIPSADIAGLGPDVREFDPMLALDGGRDGLDVYRGIAAGLSAVAGPSAIIAMEVGVGQAADVANIFRQELGHAVASVRLVPDLGGIPRCVAVRTRI